MSQGERAQYPARARSGTTITDRIRSVSYTAAASGSSGIAVFAVLGQLRHEHGVPAGSTLPVSLPLPRRLLRSLPSSRRRASSAHSLAATAIRSDTPMPGRSSRSTAHRSASSGTRLRASRSHASVTPRAPGHLRGRLSEQPQLAAGLLGLGERGPALLLDDHPLGDVGLHAHEVDQIALLRRTPERSRPGSRTRCGRAGS